MRHQCRRLTLQLCLKPCCIKTIGVLDASMYQICEMDIFFSNGAIKLFVLKIYFFAPCSPSRLIMRTVGWGEGRAGVWSRRKMRLRPMNGHKLRGPLDTSMSPSPHTLPRVSCVTSAAGTVGSPSSRRLGRYG